MRERTGAARASSAGPVCLSGTTAISGRQEASRFCPLLCGFCIGAAAIILWALLCCMLPDFASSPSSALASTASSSHALSIVDFDCVFYCWRTLQGPPLRRLVELLASCRKVRVVASFQGSQLPASSRHPQPGRSSRPLVTPSGSPWHLRIIGGFMLIMF